jgi:hypothetical protein
MTEQVASGPSLLDVDAVTVIDLAVGAMVRRGATVATIERARDRYEFTVRKGTRVIGAFTLRSDVVAAAIARLARMTGLDPIAEAGTPEGRSNVARLRVRADDRSAQLIVSLAVRGDAFEVELRVVSLDGREVEGIATAVRRCPECGTLAAAPDELCPRDRTPLVDVVDDPRPGGTIGTYRVDEELGRGGMGTVLGAVHVFLDRPVAIKVLHREIAPDAQQARGFLSEARAASRVRDPRLVEVFDYGVLADGRPYVVMERLDGEALIQRLQREGALEPATALRIARELARALAAAHGGGVVHNDLKPSNVMMLSSSTDASPRLKVIDFGAASLLQSTTDDREFVIGTPQYMSPEQIRGAPTDARSDVYAIGVVVYRLLTNSLPFDGVDVRKILRGHLETAPPVVTSTHGVLPRAVTRLVSRALSKSPAERHQSAGELASDLDRALTAVERPGWMRWLR